ncbi:hypothetical protein Tco_0210536 [Tanacetum coccineum]
MSRKRLDKNFVSSTTTCDSHRSNLPFDDLRKLDVVSELSLRVTLGIFLIALAVFYIVFLLQSVAFLEKSTGSEGFHQIIDFLSRSHISYALTRKPEVYISFIKQFWRTAEATTGTDGKVQITATIDGHSKAITEASLRRHLKLEDHDGIDSLPNSEIFEQLALMGYPTDSDKLTFQKGDFSPQWRFLIHTILHCLSPKKTSWEQFSSNIATAIICLATNRKSNFSKLIFEHMVTNISSPHKFLMYPRFIQISLDMQKKQLQPHTRTYPVPSLNPKVFNNMKRPTKGYSGVEVDLFPIMLNVPSPASSPEPLTSPSRITSSPSQSSEPSIEPTTTSGPSTSPTQPTQHSFEAEEHVLKPHDSPLYVVHSHTHIEVMRGRKISNIDEDPNVFLAQDEGVEWFQEDTQKGQPEVSTADIPVSTAGITTGTASVIPTVSTANVNISTASTIRSEIRSTAGRVVYSRRSDEIRKDKGKAIMTEPEPKKKSKKELEQERLSFETSIRLQEQADEEKRHRLQGMKRLLDSGKNKKKKSYTKISCRGKEEHDYILEESGNYKIKDFQGMTYDEIRPIFEKVWDFNQNIVPMDSKLESQKVLKRKSQKKPAETQKIETEQVEKDSSKDSEDQKEEVEAEKDEEDDIPEQIVKEVSKKSGGKRRKILAKKRTKEAQDKETSKRQKLDEKEADDQEEENITQYIEIVPVEEIAINAIPLATKPPVIVDVEIFSEGQMSSYYIIRADGNSRRYSTMTLLFQDIDREDLENLWKIVKEKFKDASHEESYKRVLWGDLKVMFEPDMESEVWKMIENYDVTAWILYSSCGVHLIKFEGLHIFLLVDKSYPLTYATITKMLDRKLQADHQNEMAYQLLKRMLKLQQQKK